MATPAPETGYGLITSEYVPHYTDQALPYVPLFDMSLDFEPPDPEKFSADISMSLAQAARQKAETLGAMNQQITRAFLSSMNAYRAYRLEELFMEEKPLEEQLTILRQRLKQHGQGPPLEIPIAPQPITPER